MPLYKLIILTLSLIVVISCSTGYSPNEAHECRHLTLITGGKCISSQKCPYLLQIQPSIVVTDFKLIVNNYCFTPISNDTVSYLCCGKNQKLGFQSDYSICGKSTEELMPTDRIFGGESAEYGSHTWHTLLRYRKVKVFACAGTIISSKYVLTAAHCAARDLIRQTGELQSVVIALNNLIDVRRKMYSYDKYDPRHKEIRIRTIISHPKYDSNQKHNDIAILRLNEEIIFDELNVVPICLPRPDFQSSKENEYVTGIGFGRTEDEAQSYSLLEVKLPIVSKYRCASVYTNRSINNDQICAGGIINEDTCDGDSGGALMTLRDEQWILEGLTSYGAAHCGSGAPSVFTRITSHLDWILSKME